MATSSLPAVSPRSGTPAPLTSRERLLRALRGEMPDRVPIWMLYPREGYGAYVDVYRLPAYREIAPYIRQHTDFFDRRGLAAPFLYTSAAGIQTQREETAEGAILRQTLNTPYGLLAQESRTEHNTSAHWQTEYLFKEIEHLQWALAIPYVRAAPDLGEIKEAEKRLDDDGLMMVDLPSPISSLHSYASPANLASWIVTDMDTLVHYLDVVARRQLDWLAQALEAGAGPVFFVTGTEFVAPPLASPTAFARLATRYNKPLFDLIHHYDAHIIVHHHGRARQVLEQIIEAGADGVQPIEEPPVGDLPLAAAKELMRERCTIVGSIQYDDLARLDDDAFEELVRRQIRDAAPGGRFILAPTAGPYEAEITPQHARNLRQMIDLAHELGTYPLRADI